jgi:hypothetical protein
LKYALFQEPAENLECPQLIAAFIAEQKQQARSSTSKVNEGSTRKRTQSDHQKKADEEKKDRSDTKRSRINFEQTGYHRGLVPDRLMGATDIYDGELMFL